MHANCCLKSFAWNGTPTGKETTLGSNKSYVTGTNTTNAVFFVHDALGWTFPNSRLLADHYAKEANATVYLPDFFDGEVLPTEPILAGRFDEVDMAGFTKRNARDVREPEIFACARLLREQYKHVAAIGFCFGGWACFRLGSEQHNPPLVDCISVAHPTWVTEQDIDEVNVPVQVLAPEHDQVYPMELKKRTFELAMKKGLYLNYVHFPKMIHGSLARGDENVEGERVAMARAKNLAVAWFREFLED